MGRGRGKNHNGKGSNMEWGGGYGANPGVCLARLLGARAPLPPPSHKLLRNYSVACIPQQDGGRLIQSMP